MKVVAKVGLASYVLDVTHDMKVPTFELLLRQVSKITEEQSLDMSYKGLNLLDELTIGAYNIQENETINVFIIENNEKPTRLQKEKQAREQAEKEAATLKAKVEALEKEKDEKEEDGDRVTDEMIVLLQKRYDKAVEEANEAVKIVFKHKAEGATKSELTEPLANEKAAKTKAKAHKQELDEAKARKKQQDKEDKENKTKKQNIMDKDPKDTYLAALH